jgi:carbonic anhydrase
MVALVACGGAQGNESPTAPSVPKQSSAPTAHWSYEGATGPEAWAKLEPSFSTCGGGQEQSPVDLVASALKDDQTAPKLVFAYRDVALRVSNNGHAVLSDETGSGAKIVVDGNPFELVQFHVHTPSEHELEHTHTDLELHFVHKDASGATTVVALLAKRGAENAMLAPFFSHLPGRPEEGTREVSGRIDLSALIGNRHAYWAYEGSLTTPPCSEHVHWFVLDEPIEVSAEQIAGVRTAEHGMTARPVQPLGVRHLAHVK